MRKCLVIVHGDNRIRTVTKAARRMGFTQVVTMDDQDAINALAETKSPESCLVVIDTHHQLRTRSGQPCQPSLTSDAPGIALISKFSSNHRRCVILAISHLDCKDDGQHAKDAGARDFISLDHMNERNRLFVLTRKICETCDLEETTRMRFRVWLSSVVHHAARILPLRWKSRV
jgi:hypothetical protein